ncbi:MAG: polysaccharide pyruvyl transferase family protein [Leptolyngbyaceae cyanobacterium SL_7_1]|nr:polysaccharide pyruvyl transferase family protein [Leptolyngbyaceae cyanobacterium SL_7_1]
MGSLLHPTNYTQWHIPLCWAAIDSQCAFANLGDALSPIIISTLSDLPSIHQNFHSRTTRLAGVGTIAHHLKYGTVHLWGTGVSNAKGFSGQLQREYGRRPDTQFYVHALRGPLGAEILRKQGITVPAVYGDPVWLLPSIIPPAHEKKYELGVIVHISELAERTDNSGAKDAFLRYQIPEELKGDIKIITTLVKPTFDQIESKVKAITACKRIVSTSLHGLVIAETYRIPCLYFRTRGRGVFLSQLDDDSEKLDFRIRDFYSGLGLSQLLIYRQPRKHFTDWNAVIHAIDQHWQPIEWSPEAFLDAFPLPLAFNPLRELAQLDYALLGQIKF